MKKILTLTLLLLLSLGMVWAADSNALPSGNAIIDAMKKINPGLKDYTADIKVKIKVQLAILPLSMDLQGKYYYKKPDKYKLELQKAPKTIQKYPQIFGWRLPEVDINTFTVNNDTLNGVQVYHVTITPSIGRGDIINEEMWVDKDKYVFYKYATNYKNDGKIETMIKYRNEKGNSVFDHVDASFSFPKIGVNATAAADYPTYQLNTGLTDEFFNDQAPKSTPVPTPKATPTPKKSPAPKSTKPKGVK